MTYFKKTLVLWKLTFWMILIPIFALAQGSPLRFKQISVNTGLSQNSVWSICRDMNGMIWVGTADGLNKYDGVEVKNFKHKNGDTRSISGNNINFVYQDKYQKIWIGSEGGIDIYNPITNDFDHVYQYPVRSYSDNRSYLLFTEPSEEYIYILLSHIGIKRYSINNPSISENIIFPKEYQYCTNCYIKPVGADQKYGYLAISNSSLLQLDFKTRTWNNIIVPKKNSLDYFYVESKFYYLLNGQLYSYNLYNQKTFRLCDIKGINKCTRMIKVNNSLLLISESGYAFYDFVNKQSTSYNTFYTDKLETYSRLSSALYDYEGNLWIGTDGKGVYYTSLYANKFKTYKSTSDDENMVKGITKIDSNHIAVASYNKGILIYNLTEFTHTSLEEPSSFPNAKSMKFTSIVLEKDKNVWVSNTEDTSNGLFYVNLNNKLGVNYSHLVNKFKPKSIIGPFYTFLIKNDHKLYALNLNQIIEITENKGKFVSKLYYESRNSGITCFYFSKNGKYFLVGKNNCINIINRETQKQYVLKDYNSQITKCIIEDIKGNYYVATTNGVIIYDSLFRKIGLLNIESGLPDNFTYGLLCDDKNTIWISHNKGITNYNPQNDNYKSYDVNDGLQSNEFNTGAFYKDDNGDMYFGGVNGLNRFNPKDVIDNLNQPKILITGIKLFDEPFKSDTSIPILKSLNLNYTQNTLSFEFIALEFADLERNNYVYRLEGYDNYWIESGNKHYARYANLPPGEYTFQVMAANADGIWNPNPKEIFIHIRPPFWKTNWFDFLIVLFGILFALSILYLIYARQEAKLKREREIQLKLDAERLRISRDLHDHVGAQLSYLVTNIDWMRTHPGELSEIEEDKRLKSLEESGRQAILTLRQTIWAISQHELSVEELADRIKQYVIKMLEYNSWIQVHFSEKIERNIQVSPFLALNIFRVCQEAFNNAVKHACCKNIYINFSNTAENTFAFEIEDDGKGFDPDSNDFDGHYGLQNMRARAEESNVTFTLNSTIGKGTKVIIEM